MFWWRVEFGSQGAIASCTKVEKTERGTASVRYVRAARRQEAIELAQRWHERRKQNQRASSARLFARRRAAGACIRCGNPLDGASEQLCSVHFAARAEYKQRVKAGLTKPREKGDPVAMHGRELEWQRQRYRMTEQLPDVLERFDSLDGEPDSRFRAWLVEQIAAIEARYPVPG